MGVKIFGRNPAVLAGFANALIAFVGAFLVHLSASQEAALIAVASTALGVVVAYAVHDGQVAAILGAAKAVLALALAFGAHFSTGQQTAVMSLVTMAVAMFVRTQVTAPVAADGGPAAIGGAGESGQMGPDA